ncbi:MAG: SCO family protein [Pseudomonadota bacterium]
MRRPWLIGLALAAFAGSALAHNGVIHGSEEEAAAHRAETAAKPLPPLPAATPFPVEIDVSFDLVDQTGARRTEADYAGRPALLFFGYASCEAICSVALPRMATTLDMLGDKAGGISALMITVDPENDTPEALAESMPEIHPQLVGLTGSEDALAAARDVFQVNVEKITEMPDGTPIYAHGSFIYLIDAEGMVATVLPPILSEERMAEIIERYL